METFTLLKESLYDKRELLVVYTVGEYVIGTKRAVTKARRIMLNREELKRLRRFFGLHSADTFPYPVLRIVDLRDSLARNNKYNLEALRFLASQGYYGAEKPGVEKFLAGQGVPEL